MKIKFLITLLFLAPTLAIAANNISVDLKGSNTLVIKSNAYFYLCAGQLARAPDVSVQNGESWKDLITNAPGRYYLNKRGGKVQYSMPCDVVSCQKSKWPIEFTPYPFEKIGEKNKLPVLKKFDLKGKIFKVKIPYFTDKKCQHRFVYEKVLN